MEDAGHGSVAWNVRPEAEEAFARFVTSHESWSSQEFREFCSAHDELAPDLRRLAQDWLNLAGVFRRAGALDGSAASTLCSRALPPHNRVGAEANALRFDPAWSMAAEDPRVWADLDARLADVARHCTDPARYVPAETLGRGGMGEVWRVRDILLDRDVALKVVKGDVNEPSSGTAPGATASETPGTWRASHRRLARFEREVRVLGRLDHPGILRVHDFGLDAQGRPYFTMPVVEGRHFGQVIDEVCGRGARSATPAEAARAGDEAGTRAWDLARAVGVLHRVSEAMAYAHERGVVHRDLKPSNVMVGRFGETYVMDWGLAKVVAGAGKSGAAGTEESEPHVGSAAEPADTDRRTVELTLEGRAVGTAAFMAPEQAAGQAEAVGPPADIYALGAMLYQLLAGHPPYLEPGTALAPHDVLERLLQGPPRALHALRPARPAELVAICERAMARAPSDRYPDMQAFAEDLRAWLDGRVVRAHRTGALTELRKWVLRNRLAASGLAAAVLALVVIVAISVDAARQQRRALVESQVRAAELAGQRGEWLTSIGALDEALASGGDLPRVHLLKARALIALVRADAAREELARVEALDTEGSVAGERLLLQGCLAMLGWGASNDARHVIEQAIEAGLSPADEAYAYGLISESAPRAEQLFAAALKADPFHFLAWDALAQTQFWRGRITECLRSADRMADVFPKDPTPAVLRCSVACLTGDDSSKRATLDSMRGLFDEQALAGFKVFADLATEAQKLARPEDMAYGIPDTGAFRAFLREAAPRLLELKSPVLLQLALGRTPNLVFVGESYARLAEWFATLALGQRARALDIITEAESHNPTAMLYYLHSMTLMQDFDQSDEGKVQEIVDILSKAAAGEALLPGIQTAAVFQKAFLTGLLHVLRQTEASRQAEAEALRGVVDDPRMPPRLLADCLPFAAHIGEWGLARDFWRRWSEVVPHTPETRRQGLELALVAGAPWVAIEESDRWLREVPDADVAVAVREVRARAVGDLARSLDTWRAGAP